MSRYAGLYFCMCVDMDDNELEVLDIIHHYVEILDRYFGSVSFYLFFVNRLHKELLQRKQKIWVVRKLATNPILIIVNY